MADDSLDGEAGENPVIVRARKRFQQAIDAESENRSKQLDDMRFLAATPDDNYQWPEAIINERTAGDNKDRPRPCLTINKLRSHQRQVINELRMNRPQITVRPADSKASKEVAKVLNGWLRHIQVASEADLAFDTAGEWQTGGGEGFFRMYNDFEDPESFEQTVVFAPLPDRMKVYLDPIGLLQHPAGRKCRWGFIVEELPREEYEALYPEEEEKVDWNLAGEADQKPWFPQGNEIVRVAEYFEIVDQEKTLCLWEAPLDHANPQAKPQRQSALNGSNEEKRYIAGGWKKVDDRQTKIPRCVWRKMNGQKEIRPKREMPTCYVPIIRVVGNQWVFEGKLQVDGMVRPAKDAQRMYNFNASADVEASALQPIAPLTAALEQIKGHEEIYAKANRVPVAYLPYNLVYDENGNLAKIDSPTRVQPPVPAAAFLQGRISADNDIKATMGQWGESIGEPSNAKSGKAINARKAESDVGTFHFVDNFARALRYAGTIALDMAPELITEKRIVRILGEDGEPDHVVVDPDQGSPYLETQGADGKTVKSYNFSIGKYEVVVNTGPSFTTKRAEAAEFLTTAVQSARDPATANTLAYLAMKNQDWAGAEEAVTVLKALLPPPVQQALAQGQDAPKLPAEAQAAMDQLKQAVGHLQGQLDAAKQALAERDQKVRDMDSQAKGKTVEAMSKVYESDLRALAEITKARAELLIAQVDAAKVGAATGSMDVGDLAQALAHAVGELDGKIQGLTDHAAAIKNQLDTFEIAGRMPQQSDAQVGQTPVGAPPAQAAASAMGAPA